MKRSQKNVIGLARTSTRVQFKNIEAYFIRSESKQLSWAPINLHRISDYMAGALQSRALHIGNAHRVPHSHTGAISATNRKKRTAVVTSTRHLPKVTFAKVGRYYPGPLNLAHTVPALDD